MGYIGNLRQFGTPVISRQKVPQTTDRPPRLTPSYISGILQHSWAWIPTNGAHNNNNNNNPFPFNDTRPPIEWIRVSWHGLYSPAEKSSERYELIRDRESAIAKCSSVEVGPALAQDVFSATICSWKRERLIFDFGMLIGFS